MSVNLNDSNKNDQNWSHCFDVPIESNNIKQNSMTPERILFTVECFIFKLQTDTKFSLLILLFVVLILFEVSVNLLVLVSIMLEKSKKRIDLCFASNAFADLIIGIVIMPFTAIYTIFGYFPMNEYSCFIWNILDFTLGTVSMLHILYISYDRYLSVSKPLKYTQKTRASFSMEGLPTYIIIIFIWICAFSAWVPVILYLKTTNNRKTINNNYSINEITRASKQLDLLAYDCNVPAEPHVIIPHSMLVYFTPMFLIFMFYAWTIRIVSQKVKKRRSSTVSIRYLANIIAENTHNNQEFLLATRNSIINSRRPSNRLDNFKNSDKFSFNTVNGEEKNDTVKTHSFLNTKIIINREKFDDSDDKSDLKFYISAESLKDSSATNLDKRRNLQNADETKTFSSSNKIGYKFSSSLNNLAQIKSQKLDTNLLMPRKNHVDDVVIVTTSESKDSSNASLKNDSSIGILKKNTNSNINTHKKKLSFCSSYQNLDAIKSNSKIKNLKTAVSNKSSNSEINTIFENNSALNNEGTNKRRVSHCAVGIASNRHSTHKVNVTYKLGFIMFTFLGCWLPFSIMWPLMSICSTCINENVYHLSFWLAYANSIFTPLILAYNNSKYRQAIYIVRKKFFNVFCCRKEDFNAKRRESIFISNIDGNSLVGRFAR